MGLKKILSLICLAVFFYCFNNRGYSQNIGINTDGTAPETGIMLHIKGGTLAATNGFSNIFQVSTFDASTAALKLRLGLGTNSTATSLYGSIDVYDATAGVNRALSLQPSGGNVGIGTTTPSANLHIYNPNMGGTVVPLRKVVYVEVPTISTNGYSIFEGNGGSTFCCGTIYGLKLDFTSGMNGTRYGLYVDGESANYFSGNVGVGTNPNNKLHILTAAGLDGIYQSDGTRWLKYMSGTVGNGSYNNITQANDNAIIFSGGAQGSGNLVIAPWGNTGVTSGIRIDNNGNVGVGTATPLSRIQINSDINVGREWGDLLAITQISNDLGEIQNIADGGAGGFTMTNGSVLTTSACGGHRLLVGYISLPAGKYQISIQNRATTTAALCNGGGNGPNMMRISVWLVNGGTLSTDPVVATADSPSPVNTSKVVYTTNGPIATIAAGTYGIWIVVNQYLGEYNGYLLSAKIHKVE